jgi:hypothetical protein
MMQKTALETAVRFIVDLLVRGEYETVERLTRRRRLGAYELRSAISTYGRTLVPPGPGWWDAVRVTPIEQSPSKSFHVAAPLWTQEEGRSDLTVELRLTESGRELYDAEVLDLHVL